MREEMFFLAEGLGMSWSELQQMDQVDRIWLVKRLNKHNEEMKRQMDATVKR
jgi:hypothetical protein